jgi:hypothetical protein
MATAIPAWKQYQCQIPLFTDHPGMGGENLSLYTPCRALFRHRSPSRQNTTSVVPQNSQGSALSIPRRPTSTRPRSGLDQPPVNKEARPACHRIQVFLPSHPLRHHGVRGWPAILGARRYRGFHSTRQNFISKASPGVSASSGPYKRASRGLCKVGRTRRNKSSPHRRRSTSQAISFVLSLSL